MARSPGLSRIEELIISCDTSGKPLPGSIVPCLMCVKPFMMLRYSGAPDQVCPECFVTFRDAARIVCIQCKITIARVEPEVMDSGFVIRARSVLHVDACNVCKPGLMTSVVLEVDKWERMVGRKTIVEVRFKGNKSK